MKRWKTEKKCEFCGELYSTHHTKQKYCSNICRADARKGTKTNHKREEKTCSVCGITFMGTYQSKYCSRECYNKTRTIEYGSEESRVKKNKYQLERSYENKRFLFSYKQEKGCKVCGFSDARGLIFHHRIPEEKSFNLGRGIKSMKKVLEEIEKCDVLCGTCHLIEHFDVKYLVEESH